MLNSPDIKIHAYHFYEVLITNHAANKEKIYVLEQDFIILNLAFDFSGSVWSFIFFIPATTANDLRLRRISIPDLIHYIIFLSYS